MEWWLAPLTNWVAIGSGLATTVLVIIVLVQLYLTKKEMTLRQRPWIMIDNLNEYMITFEGGASRKFDDATNMMEKNPKLKPLKESFMVLVKNTGNLPTYASYKKINQKTKLTSEDFDKMTSLDTFIITPNADVEFFNWIPMIDLEKGEKYYIGLEITYSISNKVTSKIGKIWTIDGYYIASIEDWIDDPGLRRSKNIK